MDRVSEETRRFARNLQEREGGGGPTYLEGINSRMLEKILMGRKGGGCSSALGGSARRAPWLLLWQERKGRPPVEEERGI